MDMKRDPQLDSIVEKMENESSRVKSLFEKMLSSREVALEKVREVSNGVGDNQYKKIMQRKLDELTSSINHRTLKMMDGADKLKRNLTWSKETAEDSEYLSYYYNMSKISKNMLNRQQDSLESSLENSSPEQYTYKKITFDNFQGLRGRVFDPIKQLNRDNQSLTNAINRFLTLSHQAEKRVTQLQLDAIESVKAGMIPKPEPLFVPEHTDFYTGYELGAVGANIDGAVGGIIEVENRPPQFQSQFIQTEFQLESGKYTKSSMPFFRPNSREELEALDEHVCSTECLTNQISALPGQSSLSSVLSEGGLKPHYEGDTSVPGSFFHKLAGM